MKLNIFEEGPHFHPDCNYLNKSPTYVNSFYQFAPLLETFSQSSSIFDVSPSQSRDLKSLAGYHFHVESCFSTDKVTYVLQLLQSS